MRTDDVWPMQPGGGVFLICIGIGLVCGAMLRGTAIIYDLACCFVAGVLGILIARKVANNRFGRPTPQHRLAILAAIGFELSAFIVLGRLGFFLGDPKPMMWAVILLIVALHFLVMRWSHGPLIQWLGIASLCWIGVAYVFGLPVAALIAGDGLLKIAFGSVMAAPLRLIIRSSSIPE